MQDSLAILDGLALERKGAHEKLARVSIHEQIKAARLAKGWSMERLAEEVSRAEDLAKPLSWQTVQQWESGNSAPKRTRMAVVQRLLDIEGWPEAPAPEKQGDSFGVALLSTRGSMGAGVEQLDDVVVGRLTLSPAWISKSIKPLTSLANLRFVHGYGDSMEPTFRDGDILLIDAGVQAVDVDAVYVLEANDRIYIKRVRQRFDGSFEISSDNPNVKTVDVLDGSRPVAIKGRVVWVWNGRRL